MDVNGCKRLSYLLSYNDIRIDKMIVFNILLIKITILLQSRTIYRINKKFTLQQLLQYTTGNANRIF